MKSFTIFIITLFMCTLSFAQVDKILGDWVTVDDNTGESYSVINIYRSSNGKYYGKIARMLVDDGIGKCVKCTGEDKDKPYEQLVIIRDMVEKNGDLTGGRVLDPETGKIYYAKVYLKNGNLVLRGSLDKAGILGRSQTWKRYKQ